MKAPPSQVRHNKSAAQPLRVYIHNLLETVMTRKFPFLPVIAALIMISACDRGGDNHAQGNASSPTTAAAGGAAPAQVVPSPEGAATVDTSDTRRGALTGDGADICGEWNLEGGRLVECRRQWVDAATNADRLRVRNMYAPSAGKKEASEPALDRRSQAQEASSFCEQLDLRSADLSECRAQWQAAKTEGDLARVRTRYQALGAHPDAGGSRRLGAPAEAPAANRADHP